MRIAKKKCCTMLGTVLGLNMTPNAPQDCPGRLLCTTFPKLRTHQRLAKPITKCNPKCRIHYGRMQKMWNGIDPNQGLIQSAKTSIPHGDWTPNDPRLVTMEIAMGRLLKVGFPNLDNTWGPLCVLDFPRIGVGFVLEAV